MSHRIDRATPGWPFIVLWVLYLKQIQIGSYFRAMLLEINGAKWRDTNAIAQWSVLGLLLETTQKLKIFSVTADDELRAQNHVAALLSIRRQSTVKFGSPCNQDRKGINQDCLTKHSQIEHGGMKVMMELRLIIRGTTEALRRRLWSAWPSDDIQIDLLSSLWAIYRCDVAPMKCHISWQRWRR